MADEMSSDEKQEVIKNVRTKIREIFSQHDASHDHHHIARVLHLANRIATREEELAEAAGQHILEADRTIITLLALVHDVGDRKYRSSSRLSIHTLLCSCNCPTKLAEHIAHLAYFISFNSEKQDPAGFQLAAEKHPELAIVQDADRLDALGAVGIGRAFAFGASEAGRRLRAASASARAEAGEEKGEGLDRGLAGTMEHFEEKLEKLEGLMKTRAGKEIAAERTRRLKEFRRWWEDEVGGVEEL